MARFELLLLDELGFGLDLESCAATGSRDDLVYVSPKSGRAVSRAAGEPYRDRLLPLPGFLAGPTDRAAEPAAARAGVPPDRLLPRAPCLRRAGEGLPESRLSFLRAISGAVEAAA